MDGLSIQGLTITGFPTYYLPQDKKKIFFLFTAYLMQNGDWFSCLLSIQDKLL